MATGGDHFPIWDRRNVDQQEPVHVTPCRRLLERAGVVLRDNLHTDDLLPHLRQLDVVRRVEMESITYNAPRAVVVDRLVDFILTCQMWKFHGLLRACALTGQKQLIREVGLEPGDYITEEEEAQLLHAPTKTSPQARKTLQPPEHPSTSHQETMPAELLKVIVPHCKNCKRCLMRRNLYDFGKKDAFKVVDTTTCYIKIDPLREGQQGKMVEITEKEILLALPGEEHPRVVRLEGQPGTGKTALTHHIAYDWSVEFLKKVGESIPIEVGGEVITTIVHIPARNIKTTVPDAIYDNLRCPKEKKPVLFGHVTQGKGTVIELDGIDEIRDEKVMENVREYIRDRHMYGDGPQVLLTARTDLCPIDIEHIDRFITVKGFSTSQGIDYVKAYFGDNQEMCQKVLDYVDAHQQKLFAVITNPLRLHIFCALVSEGELVLDDNDDFCILKLFTLLEKCFLKREGKKVTKNEMNNFYRMCLGGLLNGLREFSKEELERFSIAEACHVFFTKKDITTALETQVSYTFPHEMMYEFFAGRYIESLSLDGKKALLLSICAKPGLRNLQKIIFEVILQQQLHKEELLLVMLRAILILQHDHHVDLGIFHTMKRFFSRKTFFEELTLLKTEVHTPKSTEKLLLKYQHPKKVNRTNRICNQINSAFDDNPNILQEMKWYRGLGNGVFGHVSECLQSCDMELMQNLSSKTMEHLLPYEYNDEKGQHMVHTVGGSRWAEVVQEGPHVHAWCPADLQEVLHKVRMAGFTTYSEDLHVHLTTYQDTWGPPDSSAFCTQAWNEVYKELIQWEVTRAESKVTDCDLYLGPSTPLQGLLQSEVGGILWRVEHGTIGIEELYQVMTAVHLPVIQRGVRGPCYLFYTTIVVPAGGDKAALSNMKDEMLSKRGPELLDPKFVTETGEKYNWH